MSPHARLLITAVVGSALQVGSALPFQGASRIAGRVLDHSGAPLSKAAVVWLQPPVPGALTPSGRPEGVRVAGSVIADESGRFEITVPAPGQYVLCGTDREHKQVSSCEWRRFQTVVLAQPDAVTTQDITLPKGVNVRIQIVDTIGAIKPAARLTIIAADAEGSFAHARPISVSPGLRELAVTAPLDTALSLEIDSPAALADSSGRQFAGKTSSIAVAATKSPELVIGLVTK